MLLALPIAGPPSAFAQVDESALKAAFVYNIVAFASWDGRNNAGADPNTIVNTDPDVLVICTDTKTPLDASLASLAGRPIGRRRIAVHSASVEGACDVLVHTPKTKPAYTAVPKSLVICDGCDLPNGVTAVALIREGNKIRFDVDPASAANAGIGFSSQLLRLARRVM
jgi:hypothetical protein